MQQYDVVIIGSGLAGLLSAVMLAREGMKVCVLEKNKQIGGCLQTFSLHKTVFDSCVHYIGGLGEGHTLNKIFRYAGIMDQLELKAFDADGFDRIAFGDEQISYPQAVGFNNFVAQLEQYFPAERDALSDYIKTIQTVGDHFPLYRLRHGDASEKARVSGWELTATLEKITQNKRLRNVWTGNNLLYAGAAGKSPFYLHALVLESYIHSAHKVVPGSSQIGKLLWKQLQQFGGDVYRHAEVTRLVEENGLLNYAETKDGERFYGKQFIANIHPQQVLSLLESRVIRPAFRKRIEALEQTTSAFMLNLVLKPGSVLHRPYNLYWHRNDDVWENTDVANPSGSPQQYALYFTEDKHHPGYAESLSILSYMPFAEVRAWSDTTNHSAAEQERGNDYAAFKQQKSALLLEEVMKRVTDLRGNIVAESAATPLTYRDYIGAPQGSLYGILKDVNKPAETAIAIRTKIPNLLLTGQNVNLHGVLGVSITAVATCGVLTGLDYLLGKINAKQ